jgi:hypothetical protein
MLSMRAPRSEVIYFLFGLIPKVKIYLIIQFVAIHEGYFIGKSEFIAY